MSVFSRNKRGVNKSVFVYLAIILLLFVLTVYALFNGGAIAFLLSFLLLFAVTLLLAKKWRLIFEKVELLDDMIVMHSVIKDKSLRIYYTRLEYYNNEDEAFLNIVGIGDNKLISLKLKECDNHKELIKKLDDRCEKVFDYKSYQVSSLAFFLNLELVV